MSENTKIEWADHTWSPWRGCTKVSPGCANCYAETLARRNPYVLGGWGKGAPRAYSKSWNAPLRWDRHQADRSCGRCEYDEAEGGLLAQCEACRVRPRVFPSLCDWLDDEIPVEWLGRFLHLIEMTPHIDWLLLTKRPQLFRTAMAKLDAADLPWGIVARRWLRGEPPANVWFGVSVEDQTRANERIPLLLEIPARLRWLSVEPLLGPVDLSEWTSISIQHHPDGSETPIPKPIDWVVVGGESGPCARPCNVEWIRSVIYDCKTTGIPCFVKQLGSRPEVEAPSGGWVQPVPVRHRKGGDPAEWPDNLRVRKFPEANRVNTDIR